MMDIRKPERGAENGDRARPRVPHLLGILLHGRSLLPTALRFSLIGGLNGLIFAATTWLLVEAFGFRPQLASVVGYVVAVPAGFLGHRRFSFRSDQPWTGQLLRFLAIHLANIALTTGLMDVAVARIGLGYGWGVALAIAAVPVSNFLLARFWVFRHSAS